MTLKIIGISSRAAGQEICVTFELTGEAEGQVQRESFVISSRQYLMLCPQKGECSMEIYDEIAHAAQVFSALKRGISVLSFGAYSEKALIAKLKSKGFDREIAAEAVGELVSRGLLDAMSDAYREAQKQVSKLWGEKRIVAELYAKGYSGEAISAAMKALADEGVDYVANCRALIDKKYGEFPAESTERQKAISALIRYGYTTSEIKNAVSCKNTKN